jgi:hypothetical protein
MINDLAAGVLFAVRSSALEAFASAKYSSVWLFSRGITEGAKGDRSTTN